MTWIKYWCLNTFFSINFQEMILKRSEIVYIADTWFWKGFLAFTLSHEGFWNYFHILSWRILKRICYCHILSWKILKGTSSHDRQLITSPPTIPILKMGCKMMHKQIHLYQTTTLPSLFASEDILYRPFPQRYKWVSYGKPYKYYEHFVAISTSLVT